MLLTACIGHALFSPRVGWWSAAVAGLFPLFFFCSLEFRPDDLWTVLWLAAIALAVGGPATPVRSLAVGLVLGAAVAVSLKAVMMLLAVAVAVGVVTAGAPKAAGSRRRLATCALAAAAGLTAMPGMIGVAFAFGPANAAGPFFYGTILHNLTPGTEMTRRVSAGLFGIGMATLAVIGTRLAIRRTPEPALGRRRAFLVVVTASVPGARLLRVADHHAAGHAAGDTPGRDPLHRAGVRRAAARGRRRDRAPRRRRASSFWSRCSIRAGTVSRPTPVSR